LYPTTGQKYEENKVLYDSRLMNSEEMYISSDNKVLYEVYNVT